MDLRIVFSQLTKELLALRMVVPRGLALNLFRRGGEDT
jgi:hypothetical protein